MKQFFTSLGRLTCLLVLVSAPGQAGAALSFSGDLAPVNWSLDPAASFSGSGAGTQLFLQGPSGLPDETLANVQAIYLGPGGFGTLEAGTLTFTWSFNSGDSISASAEIGTPAGPYFFAATGPGAVRNGSYSFAVAPGDQFAFLLTADMPADKRTGAQFSVAGFSFAPIPEISTLWGGCVALVAAVAVYSRRARR